MEKNRGRPSLTDKQITQTDHVDINALTGSPSTLDEEILPIDDDIDSGDGGGGGDDEPPGGGSFVGTVGNIRIVSQTTRYTKEGRQVVDVVIAWDDYPGAVDYNVRITRW